jgi:hypothetical protein
VSAETVALVRASNGNRWHILQQPQEDAIVCGASLPADVKVEVGVDAHVVSHRGISVCSHCKTALWRGSR